MKKLLWIVVVMLMACASNGGSTGPTAGTSGAGGGSSGSGGRVVNDVGGSGSSAYQGASGMSAEDAGVVNTACPKVKELAMNCGINVPDKPCRPDGFCKDSCTLDLSCQELRDLASGVMSASLTGCFEQCTQ